MRSKKPIRFKNNMKSDIKRLSGSLTHKSMIKEPSLRKLHASSSQIEEGLPHRYKTGGRAKREHHGIGGNIIGKILGGAASFLPFKEGGKVSKDCGKGRYESFLKDSRH